MSLWSKVREAWGRNPGSNAAGTDQACDHGRVPHEPGTAEFELFVARKELAQGNLEHGARHLAALLSYEPGNQEWLTLLEEYLRRVGEDESKLYPIKEKRYFAEEAVRAFVWARKGKWNEAMGLLLQVVEAQPDSRYLDAWGLDWLQKQQAIAGLDALTLNRILALAVNRFPERRWLRPSLRRKLEQYATIATQAPAALRGNAEFQMLHAGLLRKLGRFDEALVVARDRSQVPAGWCSYAAEGLALRESGDCEKAAEAFERALTFDPEDLSARLEAADGYLTHDAWEKAQRWYEQVLQREADHPWAFPSALFCQWKKSGDELKRKRLAQMARRIPPNPRAEQLMRVKEPYVGVLPAPADALANAVRSIARSIRENPPQEPGGEIAINLSHLESPSATLALEEQLKALGQRIAVEVTVKTIPQPDPRIPCREVRCSLWSYDGDKAKPALPPPPAPILQIISELASHPYDLEENWNDARRVAQILKEEQIEHLLAAMVHVPPVPADGDALEWIPRAQLAAARVIAHIGQGWQGSPRRESLLSVLFGPRDWTTVAAIITLARLAEEDREIEADVNEAFSTLSKFIPDGGYCCFTDALFTCWQWLPSLAPEEKQRLQDQLMEMEERTPP